MPVASGSKIPKIPAFLIFVIFLKSVRVSFDVTNLGLFMRNEPLIILALL
tara:strand:- start:61 stop:210 length:150 start_codon:yes stop_codon:yes gene_type:complete